MATLGYIPLGVDNARYVYALHLPGVRAQVDGFSIGDVRVSKLTWAECRLLEQSSFMDDLQDVFVYRCEPFFIVFSTFFDSEIATGELKARANHAANLLIRALRLTKGGELWHPGEFVTYERNAGMNTRDPGTFGRLPFSLEQVICLDTADIRNLDATYASLDLFDRFRHDAEIDRAEALFHASYSPAHTLIPHRLLPLTAAVEILAENDAGALAEASWITEDLRETAKRLRERRNHLAHGGTTAEYKWVEPTRELTRVLLREAIAWRLEEPKRESVVGKELVQRCLKAKAADSGRLGLLSAQYPTFGLSERA